MGKIFYLITASLLSFVSIFFSIGSLITSLFAQKRKPAKQVHHEKWIDDDPVNLKHAA